MARGTSFTAGRLTPNIRETETQKTGSFRRESTLKSRKNSLSKNKEQSFVSFNEKTTDKDEKEKKMKFMTKKKISLLGSKAVELKLEKKMNAAFAKLAFVPGLNEKIDDLRSSKEREENMRLTMANRMNQRLKEDRKRAYQKEEDLKQFFNKINISDVKDFDSKLISMNKSGENGITFDKEGRPMIFRLPSELDALHSKQGFKYRVRNPVDHS